MKNFLIFYISLSPFIINAGYVNSIIEPQWFVLYGWIAIEFSRFIADKITGGLS
tara:strand:+ start:765 stop:926 length:162 start_codon:yes stop_codon:yes gene_type:complete